MIKLDLFENIQLFESAGMSENISISDREALREDLRRGGSENLPVDRKQTADDPVSHPSHYTQGGIECIDAIKSALGVVGFIGFCVGNAIKYLWRHQYKGKPIQDLEKAKWYIDRLIVHYRSTDNNPNVGV